MPSTVRNGDRGRDVKLLQRLLRDLRYDEVEGMDGIFGDKTEAAVRRYQADAELANQDGVCDQPTWQSLESQFGDLEGLRSEDSVDEFVQDTHGILNSTMSLDDRLAALRAAANEQLAAAGVPDIRFKKEALDAGTHGVFTWWEWEMSINETRLSDAWIDAATLEDQADLVSTVMHEARHAEQFFTVARLLAGLHDLDADAIHDQMNIPVDVAKVARANPILECTLANGPAFDWYESVYGSGKDHRDDVLTTDPMNYEDYRNLAEERDPKDGEVTVRQSYREYADGGWDPVARPTLRRDRDCDPDEVRYLQQLLVYRGYSWVDIDGDFGEKTEDAVKIFQRSAEIEDDGVVGTDTWAALIP